MSEPFVIDGHLDLAMNALDYERNQCLSVEELRGRETPPGGGNLPDGRGTAMVSLPELRAGNVRMVTATVLARAKPWVRPDRTLRRGNADWPSPDMAHAVARGHLAYYDLLRQRGEIRLIHHRAEFESHVATAEPHAVGVVIMMEGADPITRPEEFAQWHAWGVRCLSLAHFGHSHYACGTPPREPSDGPNGEQDGPLTDAGRQLLREMARFGTVLDLTHLSDASFAEAADAYEGPICATHANCRALADSPRQLTDEQIRQIVDRDGVIGIAIHNGMLRWPGRMPSRETVGLADVADHVLHVCDLAGDAQHVGIGSDLDGGYGRESTPRELDTHRDLHRLAPLLRERGLSEDDVAAFFGGNWLRFWRRTLPA